MKVKGGMEYGMACGWHVEWHTKAIFRLSHESLGSTCKQIWRILRIFGMHFTQTLYINVNENIKFMQNIDLSGTTKQDRLEYAI